MLAATWVNVVALGVLIVCFIVLTIAVFHKEK